MPIYEYQCSHCGHKFELHQSLGEDGSKIICPECKASHPWRIFSSFNLGGSSGADLDFGSSCSTCGPGSCSTGTCGW
jgi:putative FmdB family regulatory protein